MTPDRIMGQRAGIRWAIAWLGKYADRAGTSADYVTLDTARRDMAKAARVLRTEDAEDASDIAAGLDALNTPIVATWPEVRERLGLEPKREED